MSANFCNVEAPWISRSMQLLYSLCKKEVYDQSAHQKSACSKDFVTVSIMKKILSLNLSVYIGIISVLRALA